VSPPLSPEVSGARSTTAVQHTLEWTSRFGLPLPLVTVSEPTGAHIRCYGTVRLRELADRRGIGVVATNDVHYLVPEHGPARETASCIKSNRSFDDPNRQRFPGAWEWAFPFYLKSGAEMEAAYDAPWWGTACQNTQAVADRVTSGVIERKPVSTPRFKVPYDPKFLYWQRTGEFV